VSDPNDDDGGLITRRNFSERGGGGGGGPTGGPKLLRGRDRERIDVRIVTPVCVGRQTNGRFTYSADGWSDARRAHSERARENSSGCVGHYIVTGCPDPASAGIQFAGAE